MTLYAIDGGRSRGSGDKPGQVAPHNLEAEDAVIGAMLLQSTAVAIAAGLLTGGDFYGPANARIFDACLQLAETDTPVTSITVADHLERAGHLDAIGGRGVLVGLVAGGCASSSVSALAAIVARHAQARGLISLAGGLVEAARDGIDPAVIVGKLKDEVDALVGVTNRRNRLLNAADLVLDHLDLIAAREDNPDDEAHGIRIGWRQMDDLLGGFRPGQLIVIAGRPGMGKSAVAAGIALRTALTLGLRVLTVSIEMSKDELLDRYVAATARVDLTKVRSGKLTGPDWARCNDAATSFDGKNLWVLDDPTTTLPAIHAAAQRIEADLVIVDYLQIVDTLSPPGAKHRTREREVAELSGGLKRMARDLSVPVIALSQFNRDLETRHSDKRPQLTDLRESGAIENDADAVVGLFRDDYYNPNSPPDSPLKGVLEMIVLKQRNGPTGEARLFFEAFSGRIGNAVPKHQQGQY